MESPPKSPSKEGDFFCGAFDLPNRHPVGLLKCILDKTTQITRAGKFFILKIFPFPLAIRAALSKNYARANPKDRMTTYTANQKDRR